MTQALHLINGARLGESGGLARAARVAQAGGDAEHHQRADRGGTVPVVLCRLPKANEMELMTQHFAAAADRSKAAQDAIVGAVQYEGIAVQSLSLSRDSSFRCSTANYRVLRCGAGRNDESATMNKRRVSIMAYRCLLYSGFLAIGFCGSGALRAQDLATTDRDEQARLIAEDFCTALTAKNADSVMDLIGTPCLNPNDNKATEKRSEIKKLFLDLFKHDDITKYKFTVDRVASYRSLRPAFKRAEIRDEADKVLSGSDRVVRVTFVDAKQQESEVLFVFVRSRWEVRDHGVHDGGVVVGNNRFSPHG